MTSRPIGVFDSGLGGLTVVHALQSMLPNENVVYLGDTARVPYGNKSTRLVREYSLQISDFLVDQGAKMIVIACNTASAVALEALQQHVDVPVLGVIEPGAQAALAATRNKHIGVIGTIATIDSGSYETALLNLDATLTVSSQACPLFVPLVEEGWLDGAVTEQVAEKYLAPVNQASTDTLILGCTHYPLLKKIIQEKVNPGTVLVDSAQTTAVVTKLILDQNDLRTDRPDNYSGSFTCYVTDLPARFEQVAGRFLGHRIDHVQTIHLS